MNREVHVRFWERLGVKFPGPTQPALIDAAPRRSKMAAIRGLSGRLNNAA